MRFNVLMVAGIVCAALSIGFAFANLIGLGVLFLVAALFFGAAALWSERR